jgi:hypothetical protein
MEQAPVIRDLDSCMPLLRNFFRDSGL